MIFAISSPSYGNFTTPQITLVTYRTAVSLEAEFAVKVPRGSGVFCGVDPESNTLHLWCNPKRATLERIVAEISEGLAILLTLNDAANIDAVAWIAKQSFLWALKVAGRDIDGETLQTIKAHRKRNIAQRAKSKAKKEANR